MFSRATLLAIRLQAFSELSGTKHGCRYQLARGWNASVHRVPRMGLMFHAPITGALVEGEALRSCSGAGRSLASDTQSHAVARRGRQGDSGKPICLRPRTWTAASDVLLLCLHEGPEAPHEPRLRRGERRRVVELFTPCPIDSCGHRVLRTVDCTRSVPPAGTTPWRGGRSLPAAPTRRSWSRSWVVVAPTSTVPAITGAGGPRSPHGRSLPS
jgi:hypothetical protein